MERDLIDNELNETPKDLILGILRWWERKRLLFNLIIVGIALIIVIPYLIKNNNGTDRIFSAPFFIQSFLYLLFINICYCAGWVIQLLVLYYFKIRFDDSKSLDYFLFVVGTLCTGFVTYAGLYEFLRFL